MKIELATDSQVPEIIELWKELMDFHKNIDPFYTISADAHVKMGQHVKDLIKSKDAYVLVALDKGKVIAYSVAQAYKYPPVFDREYYGIINDLAVKSEYRRKGIGSQLLSKMFEWFESRKLDRIELRVIPDNKIGNSFWKKHGFKDYLHRLYLERK